MNLNNIIKQNEKLSNLPYLYVVAVMVELEQMGLLKEISNDAIGSIAKSVIADRV